MNQFQPLNTEKKQKSFSTDTLTNVLKQLDNFRENSCLQVVHNSVTFFIHLNNGRLIYATNSLAPFERLERHLRRLSNQHSKLNSSIIKQPRVLFRNNLQAYTLLPSDYQGVLWLFEQNHLKKTETITLLRRITREVFESFLCLTNSTCKYRLVRKSEPIKNLCQFDLKIYTAQCQTRIKAWNVFGEKIWSSYQRPYLVTENTKEIGNLTPRQNKAICKLLKGLNFRQISAILDLDELVVVKLLYPSIRNNSIVVRDPKPPFDQLPKLPKTRINIPVDNSITELGWHEDGNDSGFYTIAHSRKTIHAVEKTWKVAYVNNTSSAYQGLTKYLDPNRYLTVTIQDSLNLFTEITEFNPDIIFLDGDMLDSNGYQLCKRIRSHQDFMATPIILVEKNTKEIDWQKFNISGMTDHLRRPYNQAQLESLTQKYLDS